MATGTLERQAPQHQHELPKRPPPSFNTVAVWVVLIALFAASVWSVIDLRINIASIIDSIENAQNFIARMFPLDFPEPLDLLLMVLETLAIVTLLPDGERSFIFYRKPGADIMLREEELPLGMIGGSRIFHFAGVALTDDPARSANFAAVRHAKDKGVFISFDCNYRPFLWESEEQARKVLPRALPFADIVKVSEEELLLITGIRDQQQAAASIQPARLHIDLRKHGGHHEEVSRLVRSAILPRSHRMRSSPVKNSSTL